MAGVQLRGAGCGGGAMNDSAAQAREVTLLDLLDRVIDNGVILAGDVTISVADVDLIYLGLRVLLAPVERLPELVTRPPHGGRSEVLFGERLLRLRNRWPGHAPARSGYRRRRRAGQGALAEPGRGHQPHGVPRRARHH